MKNLRQLIYKPNGKIVALTTPSVSPKMISDSFVLISDIKYRDFEYFMDYSELFIEKIIELSKSKDFKINYSDFSGHLGIDVEIENNKLHEIESCKEVEKFILHEVESCKEVEKFIQDLMNEIFETDEEFRDNFELMFAY